MAARITFSIVNTPATDIPRVVRSFAAKVDINALQPGADVTVGNVRVQVATPEVSDIRQFAIDNADTLGWTPGSRGRYPKHVIEAFNAHVKAQKAQAAAERKAAREAKAQAKAEAELAAV